MSDREGSMHIKICMLVVLFLLAGTGELFSQCSTCTTCPTSSSSGCTWTVSSSSSTDYTVGSGDKLCITGGTYSGDITMDGGTVVVASGATFNPGSITFFGFDCCGTIETQSGSTSTIPGFSINSFDPFTWNNCGSLTMNGSGLSINSTSAVTFNNSGTYTSSQDISFNGAGTFCNNGTMYCQDFSANGTSGSAINNSGKIYISGNLTTNSTCPINVCQGSYVSVGGDYSGNGSQINGVASCGAIEISGTSTCNGCDLNGSFDFCDATADSPGSDPTFDTDNASSIEAAVTQCTCYVLPMELLKFSAVPADQTHVRIQWVTASETNNDYFSVQRSEDGKLFTNVSDVKGNGTKSSPTYYEIYDEEPLQGVSYYRLKQTDFDGKTSYSPIVPVKLGGKEAELLNVFPNPATDKINSILFSPENGTVKIEISDLLGNIISSQSGELINGINQLETNTSSFSSGTYFLKIITPTGVIIKNFSK